MSNATLLVATNIQNAITGFNRIEITDNTLAAYNDFSGTPTIEIKVIANGDISGMDFLKIAELIKSRAL